MPAATGAVAIVGAVIGPWPALLIGWSYWVAVWSANAAIAIAATSYLAALFPGLDATPLTGALVSVGLIWALTLLNVAGARRAGEFQVVTTLLKLLPLLAVVGHRGLGRPVRRSRAAAAAGTADARDRARRGGGADAVPARRLRGGRASPPSASAIRRGT